MILIVCQLLLLFVTAWSSEEPVASFPLQFTAKLSITAHLIDPDAEYPPRTREYKIYYDYLNKKARADVGGGYEAAKSYIRRYDSKVEYMVRDPPIDDCKRSYLAELMPFPDLPNSRFQHQEHINGILCSYFLYEDLDTRIHMYMDSTTGAPVRLIQESVDDQESTALLTYEYSNVALGIPPEEVFEVIAPHTPKSCTRHVGGFPYLHIFHHFVRF